jgi:hypothetical protein
MLPLEPTQHEDDDMDGFGDSQTGDYPDSCPDLYGSSIEQRYGCPDTDGDGWDDELDVYPYDLLIWSDIDGDSYPDQSGTNMSDDCPDEAGESYEDRIGCLDTDGDGWSDESDAFPSDGSRHLVSETSSLALILSIAGVVGFILIGLVLINRRRNGGLVSDTLGQSPPIAMAPIAMAPIAMAPIGAPTPPPLPPEGLPPGWTMDQWTWYGEDYLKGR